METLMVDRVHSSLRLFMHRNAIFLCERLCAQFPSEVAPSSPCSSVRLVRLDSVRLRVGNGTSGARIGRGAVIRARGLTSAVQFDLVAFCDFFFLK